MARAQTMGEGMLPRFLAVRLRTGPSSNTGPMQNPRLTLHHSATQRIADVLGILPWSGARAVMRESEGPECNSRRARELCAWPESRQGQSENANRPNPLACARLFGFRVRYSSDSKCLVMSQYHCSVLLREVSALISILSGLEPYYLKPLTDTWYLKT
jgi:hypothetical protein